MLLATALSLNLEALEYFLSLAGQVAHHNKQSRYHHQFTFNFLKNNIYPMVQSCLVGYHCNAIHFSRLCEREPEAPLPAVLFALACATISRDVLGVPCGIVGVVRVANVVDNVSAAVQL